MADPEYTFTLDKPFKMNAFIPFYSYFRMTIETLPNNDTIVSNTTFTTFNLTNGILSSQSNGITYYLQNQTGSGFPSYVLKRGQAKSSDISIFGATRNNTYFGRSIAPNITTSEEQPGSANRWVACKTTDNVYRIGWDADITTQPPEGCINFAKYNPGVLLQVVSL